MTNLITKSPGKWILPCGKCGKERHYSTYKNWKRAQYSKCLCSPCAIIQTATDGIIGKFSRNCPKCNTIIRYRTNRRLNTAKIENRLCNSCCQIGISAGRVMSAEAKQKIKDHHTRPMLGKHHSKETRRKMRQRIAAAVIARCGGTLKCNPAASNLFKSIETEFGFDGRFGGKGGEYHVKELGYFVDYYEPTLNLVIEYDEWHHTILKNRIKDEMRQKEITEYLGCKFLRISEDDSRSQVTLKVRNIL